MWFLASRIERAGFHVVRIGYNSLADSPERIIVAVSQKIDACCKASPKPVHFVGHSLGGLIIRAYLAENRPRVLGRVVLIATPNAGTPVVDNYRNSWWMGLAGPTAKSLGTGPDSFPNSLPAPDYPVGVIAGIWSRHGVDLIPGDDDGLVSLESTKVTGMADFIIVESNHAWMRYSQEVARQTIAFLRCGTFEPGMPTTNRAWRPREGPKPSAPLPPRAPAPPAGPASPWARPARSSPARGRTRAGCARRAGSGWRRGARR